jgi:hypothetical protein
MPFDVQVGGYAEHSIPTGETPGVEYAKGSVTGPALSKLWMMTGNASLLANAAITGQQAQGIARTGFSGGPVMIDGVVIGMLIAVQPPVKERGTLARVTGRNGRPTGIAFLMPAWQFPARLQPPRHSPPNWADHLRSQGELWDHATNASPALAMRLATIAQRAERIVQDAPHDPDVVIWMSGDSALRRLLAAISFLAIRPEEEAWLTPAETACALAVPCVYEAIFAVFRNALAENTALRSAIDAQADEDGPRSRWEMRLAQQDQEELASRLRTLRMLRLAHRQSELWSYEAPEGRSGRPASLADALDTLFEPMACRVGSPDDADRILDGPRLVALARQLFASPVDLETSVASRDPAFETETGLRPPAIGELNGIDLAHLLAMAGRMALDPRRMPPVVFDHLGLDPKLDVPLLIGQLDESEGARWDRDGGGTPRLTLKCRAAALEVAMTDTIAELQEFSRAKQPERAAQNLPSAFSAAGLKPAKMGRRDTYTHPRRFSLETDRMVDLLSAVELYDDPTLALRELYQNALDACRYRRARLEYCQRVGLPVFGREWSPLIRFEVGHGEDGRRFLACEDNGIGMGEAHLVELFVRTGARFTEHREFQLEYANWLKERILFYPNSRFGIGILSVFMLADEVLVQSRRLDREGRPGNGVRTTLRGPRSLFWVECDDKAPETGTRVTLLLRDDLPEELDALIEKWLWLPEFDIEIKDRNRGTVRKLSAGEFSGGALRSLGLPRPIDDRDEAKTAPQLYWSLDKLTSRGDGSGTGLPGDGDDVGRFLLDGVVINGTGLPTGLLLNLTGPLSTGMAVSLNRRELRDWSKHRDAVFAHLLASGATSLAQLSEERKLPVDRLLRSVPALLFRTDDLLRTRGEPGFFEQDKTILPGFDTRSPSCTVLQSHLLAGRAALLQSTPPAGGALLAAQARARNWPGPRLGQWEAAREIRGGRLGRLSAIRLAARWSMPVNSVIERLRGWREYGVLVEVEDLGGEPGHAVPRLPDLPHALVYPPADRVDLPLAALSKLDGKVRDIDAVLAELEPFDAVALSSADRFALAELRHEDWRTFNEDRWVSSGSDRLTLRQLIIARKNNLQAENELRDSVLRLQAVGLLNFDDIEGAFRLPLHDNLINLLSLNLDGRPPWVEQIGFSHWAWMHVYLADQGEVVNLQHTMEELRLRNGTDTLPILPALCAFGRGLSVDERRELGHQARWSWPLDFNVALRHVPARANARRALQAAEGEAHQHGLSLLRFDPSLLDLDVQESAQPLRFIGEISGWDLIKSAERAGREPKSFEPILRRLNAGGVPAVDALDLLGCA